MLIVSRLVGRRVATSKLPGFQCDPRLVSEHAQREAVNGSRGFVGGKRLFAKFCTVLFAQPLFASVSHNKHQQCYTLHNFNFTPLILYSEPTILCTFVRTIAVNLSRQLRLFLIESSSSFVVVCV